MYRLVVENSNDKPDIKTLYATYLQRFELLKNLGPISFRANLGEISNYCFHNVRELEDNYFGFLGADAYFQLTLEVVGDGPVWDFDPTTNGTKPTFDCWYYNDLISSPKGLAEHLAWVAEKKAKGPIVISPDPLIGYSRCDYNDPFDNYYPVEFKVTLLPVKPQPLNDFTWSNEYENTRYSPSDYLEFTEWYAAHTQAKTS